jgi:hypothetical protein
MAGFRRRSTNGRLPDDLVACQWRGRDTLTTPGEPPHEAPREAEDFVAHPVVRRIDAGDFGNVVVAADREERRALVVPPANRGGQLMGSRTNLRTEFRRGDQHRQPAHPVFFRGSVAIAWFRRPIRDMSVFRPRTRHRPRRTDQSVSRRRAGKDTMPETPLVPPELLNRVVDYFHPRRVVLFGSRARGESGLDSDIDLLVILDDDAPADKLTLRAGWESRRGYDRPADVIPVRDAVYRRKAKIAGTLAYEAEIDGIAVYERV